MVDVVVAASGAPLWAAWALIIAALLLLALFVLECERGKPPRMQSHWGGLGGGLGGWEMSKSLAYLLTGLFVGVLAVLVLLPPKSAPDKPARTPRTSTNRETKRKPTKQEQPKGAGDAGTTRRSNRDSK